MKSLSFGGAFLAPLFIFCLGLNEVLACPRFVEFFSDPKDVSDREGEFVEIRLDDFSAESLWVQMETKTPLALDYPRKKWNQIDSPKRLILVHDSLSCPNEDGVVCELLGSLTLPNTREVSWTLRAGSCLDSIVVPTPKPGLALQRVGESDRWVFTDPSPGTANPQYELNVSDCGLAPIQKNGTRFSLFLTGCDSAEVLLKTVSLDNREARIDSVLVRESYSWELASSNVWILASLPPDEAPFNNFLDTLVVSGDGPLVISEVHHCPQEPEPEWVEVYNRSGIALPLKKFRFCQRGNSWGPDDPGTLSGLQKSMIEPYETVVITKDTALLRSVLGFDDVFLMQQSFGYLNNSAGCLSICNGETVVDSVCWDRHTVTCPSGFNPLTMKTENTPGFVRSTGKDFNSEPFEYRISSRVVRQNGNPLRVNIQSEVPVTLRLLDSAGRDVWRQAVPAQSAFWWNVPVKGVPIGVAYISISAGKYEKVVGVLIRP